MEGVWKIWKKSWSLWKRRTLFSLNCVLWKGSGEFFLGEKLSANHKPRAVCCHLCLLADGLPPVCLSGGGPPAHICQQQPVIFSHVPSLSLSMQLDGKGEHGIWAKEARWGKAVGEWEHRALCWMKKQERQDVQSMKRQEQWPLQKV